MGVHEPQTDKVPQVQRGKERAQLFPQSRRLTLQVCLHVGPMLLTPIFAVICFLAFIHAPDNATRLPGDLLVIAIVLYAIQLGATPLLLAFLRPWKRYLLGLGLGLTPFLFTAATLFLLFSPLFSPEQCHCQVQSQIQSPVQSMESFPLFIGMAFYLLELGATGFYLFKKRLRPVGYGMLTTFLSLPILVYIVHFLPLE